MPTRLLSALPSVFCTGAAKLTVAVFGVARANLFRAQLIASLRRA